MNGLVFLVISAIIGYIFGSIPTGYLYAKSKGVDIYKTGSNSPGATNIERTLGKSSGKIVLLLDILKTIIPVSINDFLFIIFFFNSSFDQIFSNSTLNEQLRCLALFTGFFVVVGHDYPFTMKFKGGKGISCSFATMICFSPPLAAILYILQKLVSKTTKYVSAGSLFVLIAFPIFAIFCSILKIYPFEFGVNRYVLIISLLISILGIYRHRSNIDRLLKGSENKISK